MVVDKFINEEPKEFTIKDNIIIGNTPSKVENNGIAKLLLDSLSEEPDFVLQIDVKTGEKLTFAEVKDRSIRCALWMQKQGIGKNDVVTISTPHQNNDFIPCLATLYLGAIHNPWYHELTNANARRFFALCEPKIIFACEKSIDMLAEISKELEVDCKFVVYGKHPEYPSLNDLMEEQSEEEVENFRYIEPDDPKKQVGAIYFSSGTTGVPKGTMLPYATIVKNRMHGCEFHYGMNALWYSSLSWITGTNFLLCCIRYRCTRIMHVDFDVEETSKYVQNYKVNWMFITPSMLTLLCKANVFNRYDYSSVKYILVGGSKIKRTIVEECQKLLPYTFIMNTFGMTELGGLATRHTNDRKRYDSMGFVVEGVKVKIINVKTGEPLPPNKHGELCVKIDNIMLGYLKNPEETEKMIDGEGWVHTGDLAYYDEDGEITITDRIKQVIITQNHHISPSEIEEILLQHPDVKECAVVPVPHQIDVERPMAFVVKIPGAKVTAEELMELPTKQDEFYRLTGGVIFVDELLYTSTGKISVNELKERAKSYAQ